MSKPLIQDIDFFDGKVWYEYTGLYNVSTFFLSSSPAPFNRIYLPISSSKIMEKVGVFPEVGCNKLPFNYVKHMNIKLLNKFWIKTSKIGKDYNKIDNNIIGIKTSPLKSHRKKKRKKKRKKAMNDGFQQLEELRASLQPLVPKIKDSLNCEIQVKDYDLPFDYNWTSDSDDFQKS